MLPFNVALQVDKKCCLSAYQNYSKKVDIGQSLFAITLIRFAQNHRANSLLWVWISCTPRSKMRAMPPNPTEATINPTTNPKTNLVITAPLHD
jgi:hypothetical protein